MSQHWEGLLLDVDGVLHVGDEPVPGAQEAIAALRAEGRPFRLLTNTTSRPRRAIIERLGRMGLDFSPQELLTPASMAVRLCQARGYERVSLVVANPLREDLAELEAVEARGATVDAVIVGDLGRGFTWDVLNGAFRSLLRGADLIALQRNRFWRRPEGLVLDAGPFVAALEHASDRPATVAGKPSIECFLEAVQELGVAPDRVAMIGDDLEADIGGAIVSGLDGVLVRTGKFRADDLALAPHQPTLVMDSIAQLTAQLAVPGAS